MTSEAQAPTRCRTWPILLIFVLAGFATVSGCVYFPYTMTRETISGSVHAEGREIGSWTLTPDICESGFARAFFGVRMFSSQDKQFAFVYSEDPARGLHISVNIPNTDQGYGLGPADCPVLQATLQRGPMINNVRAMSGTIDLDCAAKGNTLHGHLSFENCH